ncbi:MAG TPA: polysaccharide deacetylase family protein [Candidatus Eisenbacteria bacterium]|nr:polysaccharide deacetylase family protein [Candidatus Eisenbacteria bacterium]
MSARASLPPLVLALHQTPRRATWAPLAVSAAPLRALLVDLLSRGYRFLPLDDVGPAGPPPGAALLTVDDGYSSTATVLAPLARELGIPWSVFLLVGAVGTRNDWDLHGVSLPEPHLREEEIRALAEEGVGIGSHGMNHLDATRLGDEALREEWSASRAWLERAIGRAVDAISYPWGRVDVRVAEAARDAGYRLGFALRGSRDAARAGRAVPGLAIPRLALYAPDQIPGLFAATALRAPRAGRVVRDGAGALGGWLVARALAAAGRAHA